MVKEKLKKIPIVGRVTVNLKRKISQKVTMLKTLWYYAMHNYLPSDESSLIISDNSHHNTFGRGLFSLLIEVLDIISVNSQKNISVNYRLTAYNESGNENMWDYYFEPVGNDVKKNYNIIFTVRPLHNPLLTENLDQRKIFNEILWDRIKFRSELIHKAEDYTSRMFKDKKILGVHFRGTDIGVTIDNWSSFLIKAPLEKYFDEIDRVINNFDSIFLATDDNSAYEKFQKKYGKKIITYSTIRSSGRVSIHHNTENRRLAGEEALIDSILLSKCDFFLHGHSNLATFSCLLNSNLPSKNLDLKK